MRALPVLVTALVIEDGAVAPPRIGATGSYRLIFRETPAGDVTAAVLRARAEPHGDGRADEPGRRWDGVPHDRPPVWTTRLHGAGWAATWFAPRLVRGEVELRGSLAADAWCPPAGVRGRVRRIRVLTVTAERVDGGWRTLRQDLRDVEEAPRSFDHGLVRAPGSPPTGWAPAVPGDPWVDEGGVLVDLDPADPG